MMRARGAARYIFAIALIAAGLATVYAMRSGDLPAVTTRDGFAMDTILSITIASSADMPPERILDDAFKLALELDRELSAEDPSSALSRLNSAPAGEKVPLPEGLYRAIEASLEMSDITGGAYDPTIGAVTRLWRHDGEFSVPSEESLARATSFVGRDLVELGPGRSASRAKGGVRVDLGGIGKGYASSRIASLLQSHGITSALINFGGNVVTIGERPGGGAWRIGVQHPGEPRGRPICAVTSGGGSVITAGVYERNWEADGRSYTHVYDPATGMPLRGELQSVTILTDDPIAGDALSTAFMVRGVDGSLEMLGSLPNVEAIFITSGDRGIEITVTEGLIGEVDLLGGVARLRRAGDS